LSGFNEMDGKPDWPTGSPAPATQARAAESTREALLITLTFAAGVVDAVSYLGLGRIFTANMTGNVVFLALALGEQNAPTAAHAAVALVGFCLGAIAAGQILGRPRPLGVWPRRVNRLLWAELACFVAFAILWVWGGESPAAGLLFLLIVLSSVGMGIQNAAARHHAVPGLTTTVVTGALTGLMVDLPALGISGTPQRRAVWTVTALFVGAAVGAVLTVYAHPLAPLVTVAVVAGVAVAAHLRFRAPLIVSNPPSHA
jgi:uncharacterized membrane protein YoaK (UPF0700 family)